jgi:hypothetical protein
MIESATREEFETRVGVLEKEDEGEKLVSLYDQARRNGDDIASVRTRLTALRHGSTEWKRNSGTPSVDIKGLSQHLPEMMRDAVRDIFKEREKKR